MKELYGKARREIEEKFIEDVVKRCENHPMYIQESFFNLWVKKKLSFELLDKVERILLEKWVPEYSYLWDSLTLNQKRALKLIAGTNGKNIFAAENLDRFGFRTASQLVAALSGIG
ncbi:MAG TPA: hypothetical protein ENG51_09600, partial [Deltaproteobacteria bacterium]|nr:hypothetical protein [Deltaproteobacteria bacterium]